MSSPTIYTWPPAIPAGTTSTVELVGGGSGLPVRKGGNDNIDCVNPRYASDKEPDMTERYLVIRWQDDRRNAWSKEHTIQLGRLGQVPMTLKVPALGMYRSRQWELIAQSAVPFVIVSVEEEAELLGS